MASHRGHEPWILLAIGSVLLVLSGVNPHERLTWFLEVAPILIAVPVLVVTAPRFALTPLTYRLIFLHALILLLGAHYTYARVPLGEWVKEAFGLARNHYDRLGHFAQGFIPAIVVREILIRRSPLRPGRWLFFLTACVCLAISAAYEFAEWAAAVAGGERADAFLGTQGDVWDTQWDMLLALTGAVLAQIFFAKHHDKQLKQMAQSQAHSLS